MIGMILAMAVATSAGSAVFTPVDPINGAGWITPGDYPQSMWRKGEIHSDFRLTFDDKGHVVRCEIASPGVAELDALVCPLLQKRAHVQPATDVDKQPIYGVYRNRVNWLIPTAKPVPRPVQNDVVLTVEKLPAPLESPVSIQVALLVSTSGIIENCRRVQPLQSTPLDNIACQKASALLNPAAASSATGVPVRSVQNAFIVFVAKRKDSPTDQ